MTSVSELFRSIVEEGKKLLLKKICLKLNKGISSRYHVLYDLEGTGTNL